MQEKILFVEDDGALAMGTAYVLESEGMQVIRAVDCRSAKECWQERRDEIDLVLLDVMLPDGDGFALCEWVKSQKREVPVIFLTALEDEGNVVHGLRYGDDYVTKPFRTKELVARIQANIRKYRVCMDAGEQQADGNGAQGIYRNGALCLNEREMLVTFRKDKIELTKSEYRLLQILLQHTGQILTREQLMEQLWSVDEAFVDDNTLSVYMRRLRQKLGNTGEQSYITTIRGVGYRMERVSDGEE